MLDSSLTFCCLAVASPLHVALTWRATDMLEGSGCGVAVGMGKALSASAQGVSYVRSNAFSRSTQFQTVKAGLTTKSEST